MKQIKRSITLEFNEEDGGAVLAYKYFFDKHLAAGNKIPARVLHKFFSLFSLPIIEQEKIFEIQKESISAGIINQYEKEYNFNKNLVCTRYIDNRKQECSFTGLINNMFCTLSFEIYVKRDKQTLLIHLFEIIESYFNNFKGDTEKLFSKYKRDVLIGYILFSFGYSISKELKKFSLENPPLNSDFSEAIKNTTKSLLEKKKSRR